MLTKDEIKARETEIKDMLDSVSDKIVEFLNGHYDDESVRKLAAVGIMDSLVDRVSYRVHDAICTDPNCPAAAVEVKEAAKNLGTLPN